MTERSPSTSPDSPNTDSDDLPDDPLGSTAQENPMAEPIAAPDHDDRPRNAQGQPLIDVRGPRFGAAITTTVLAVALIVQGTVGTVLLAWQVVAFALRALLGLRWSPYGNLFRALRGPLGLGAPREVEPEAPPRFAQLCGLVVGGAGLLAVLLGATTLGWVLVGVVLALSTLLATTGLCVGCELYLLGARLRAR